MRGGPWTAPPGAPSHLNPPSALPRVGNGHGGGHGGRGPHTVLVRCRVPPPGLVRAPLWRAGVGSPVGRDPRGSRRLGALGRAVCRSSRIPRPASRPLLGEGGRPLGSGGRTVAPVALKLGGGVGGGGGGAAPRPPAPPPCRAWACHLLSPARPPGVYSCRGGCRAAVGVWRSPIGRQWVSAAGGGGRGGEPPRPGSRPRFPQAGLWRGTSVCAVLGASGPPSVGSRQGGSVRAAHRGRLPWPRCPLTPGAATSSGGVRGRRLFGPPPSALRPEGEGGGSGGSPLVPWRRPLTAEGGWPGTPGPGGQPSAWGVALFPRPPLPRAGPSCRPSLKSLVPPAVLARRWPAGGGCEGWRSAVSGLRGCRFPPALVVSALPPAGGGARSSVTPYRGGGVGRGAQLPPPLSCVRRLGCHLRSRLCGGWGCGGGGLRRR